jgi:triosephosphate isomerase
MLAKLGCSYVVVGHSERRQFHLEDDELINAKVKAALRHSITPIICVGEPIEVRQQGLQVEHCVSQLEAALEGLAPEQVAKTVLAYEPIWAIGTGQVATADDAQEVAAALRSTVEASFGESVAAGIRVLYGGSVNASNTPGIMAQADIDGGLVGGASLEIETFARIVRYRDEIAL